MGYRCQQCGNAQLPKVKPHRVVAEVREKRYSNCGGASFGWEVVKEVNLCTDCDDFGAVEDAGEAMRNKSNAHLAGTNGASGDLQASIVERVAIG